MLLPQAERRGEIHFYLAKSLPYNMRLIVAFALMAVGLVVETALLNTTFWLGLPFVFAGVLMLLTRGFDNKVKESAVSADWRPAQRAEVERILDLNRKQMEWDKDAVDISCNRGFLALLGVVLVVLAAGAAGFYYGSEMVGIVIVGNGAVMLLPFWLTGNRSILKNDQLVIKAGMLLDIEDAFERGGKKDGEEFQYQIQTAGARERSDSETTDAAPVFEVPHDIKAILMFHEGPESFLGLQMQVSINSVQGTDYPYFYNVIVARPEFGGLRLGPPPMPERGSLLGLFRKKKGPAALELVIEAESPGDVDIAVIRQKTTEKTGYHTNARAAAGVFKHALGQARQLLARS